MMDFSLLRLLGGEKHEKLIAELGVERFVDLTVLAQKFVLENGVVYRVFADRVCEVPTPRRRVKLMKDIHEVGGHVGSGKLYDMLRRYYFWPGMLKDCVAFIKTCVGC